MIRIFLVEDHGVVRAGLENLLSADDRITISGVADSGQTALQLLHEGIKADVLLTDLHLGDMTGIELAKHVKQSLPSINMLILTMDADERRLKEAFRTGVKGYLLKESAADELLYGIRKVAEGRYFICTGLTARLSERMTRERNYSSFSKAEIELSNRESEILHLLADGYTNVEIADKLFTSRRTVEGHRQSLLNKAGVRNTPELIKYAMIHGLLQIPIAD